jgi:hypothetical protein
MKGDHFRVSGFRAEKINRKDMLLVRGESGVIIPLAAALLIALISIIALAVDTSRIYITIAEKNYAADFASLGALKAYFNPPETDPTIAQRATAAKTKAESILQGSYGTFSARTGQLSGALATGDTNSYTGGKLYFTKFWDRKPYPCNLAGCPCNIVPTDPNLSSCFQACESVSGGSPGSSGGCLRPINNASVGLANAAVVEIKTSTTSNALNLAFASFIGQPQFMPKGGGASGSGNRTVGYTKAKNYIFLLDLSRSMTIQSHMPRILNNTEKANNADSTMDEDNIRGEFAYKLKPGQNCNGNIRTFATWNESVNGTLITSLDSASEASDTIDGGANFEISWFKNKFKANYICTTDHPFGGAYLIDVTQTVEPLDTALRVVRRALLKFREEGVTTDNDRVALIGFDHLKSDQFGKMAFRAYGLPNNATNGVSGASKFSDRDGLGPLDGALNPDSPTSLVSLLWDNDSNTKLKNIIQQGLFPRIDTDTATKPNSVPIKDASSYIKGALEKAYDIFQNNQAFIGGDNHIVLVTNGLNSCSDNSTPGATSALCKSFEDSQMDFFNSHLLGISQIIQYSSETLARGDVKLDTFLVGRNFAPHRSLYMSPGATCMDLKEVRQARVYNQRSTSLSNPIAGDSTNFYALGDNNMVRYYGAGVFLENSAALTGGIYVPLLTHDSNSAACTGTFSINCSSGTIIPPGSTTITYQNAFQNYAMSPGATAYIDASGRMFCDPSGNSLDNQVRDEMNSLITKKPLSLIDRHNASPS